MKLFRNLLVLFIFPIILFAQSQYGDKLYLKNGSVLRGRILEVIPDSIVKIQTPDESIFVYPFSEISKIGKETAAGTPARPRIDSVKENLPSAFSLFAGIAIPTGDFAKQSGGSAKTGYMFGAQYASGEALGWLILGSYAVNKLNISSNTDIGTESDNWHSIFALTGLKIGFADPSGTRFFISPVVGVLFGTIPKVNLTLAGGHLTVPEVGLSVYPVNLTISQSSASSNAFAYGLVGECTMGSHIAVGVQYISGKPKYDVEDQIFGSAMSDSQQPVNVSVTKQGSVTLSTSLFQIYVAVLF